MRQRADLRPVQLRVIAELKASTGVQAVLGMGGGKTVCALTAVRDLLDEHVIRCAIVAAPKRVARSTWPGELDGWAHLRALDLVVLQGSPERRARLLREDHEVYVVGIDSMVWLVDELRKYPATDRRWDLLVIDELSRFKSPRGERAKKLRRFCERFDAIWGLTGTPRPRRWEDQWMPLKLISGDTAWSDEGFDDWRAGLFRATDYHQRVWEPHPFAIPLMQAETDRWSFTIPPEDTVDVPFSSGGGLDVWLPLTEEMTRDLALMQRALMVAVGAPEGMTLEEALDDPELAERIVVALSAGVASGKMTQMLQGFVYREGDTFHRYDDAKIEALQDLIEAAAGEPTLVCYHYKEDLAAIRQRLGNIPHLGAGVSDREAERLIAAWNAGELPLLLIHPASAGHGLNLQFGGRRMIWYAMTWSPELYAQTCKRLARPGQTLPVFVHRIFYDHPLERLRLERVETAMAEEAEFILSLRRV